jgi:hypothetical protein
MTMPPPRLRSRRQALGPVAAALGAVARPNLLVLAWRWRWELMLAAGVPLAAILIAGTLGPWALAVSAGLIAAAALWPPARQQLIARAWCVITPHRVRTGCAEAWIHSRRGKLPMVLLTTQQPFGERVHLWCRAGTSALDFESARPTLISACWARHPGDRRLRHAHLVTLTIRRPAFGAGLGGPGDPTARGHPGGEVTEPWSLTAP